MSTESGEDGGDAEAIVLEFLPHGRSEDDRPQYRKQPLAYAMGTEDFRLWELVIEEGADVAFGDHLDPRGEKVVRANTVAYEDLPSGAQSELDYAVDDFVADHEERFVDFYNEAQPITLRLHQLNLLPGIGKKLRNTILDERKRRPFGSFDDLEARVDGLHDPESVIVERILEELRETDLKYCTFARREGGGE